MKNIIRIGRLLARPDIFFYCLIWLIVILVFGTVSQKYIGLYQAQHKYFSSYIFWFGILPLPGGFTTLTIVTINLLAKVIFLSNWNRHKAGTIVSHIGVLFLLAGGLLTAYFSSEGSMVIAEGEISNFVEDYHERELVIFELDGEKEISLGSYSWNELSVGKRIGITDTAAKLEIMKLCRNCNIFERKKNDSETYQSKANDLDMDVAPLEKEDEANKSGAQIKLSGAGKNSDGIYISFDFIPVSPKFEIDGKEIHFAIRKRRTYLPFTIKLIDFDKKMHPGTDMAKSYQSEVIVKDGGSEWRSIIKMNEPLRYKGYTFFQSSFIEDGQQQTTVLAVVKNLGRMFPYISGLLLCVGLMFHLFIQAPKLLGRLKK